MFVNIFSSRLFIHAKTFTYKKKSISGQYQKSNIESSKGYQLSINCHIFRKIFSLLKVGSIYVCTFSVKGVGKNL
jgi:hypothetical protein